LKAEVALRDGRHRPAYLPETATVSRKKLPQFSSFSGRHARATRYFSEEITSPTIATLTPAGPTHRIALETCLVVRRVCGRNYQRIGRIHHGYLLYEASHAMYRRGIGCLAEIIPRPTNVASLKRRKSLCSPARSHLFGFAKLQRQAACSVRNLFGNSTRRRGGTRKPRVHQQQLRVFIKKSNRTYRCCTNLSVSGSGISQMPMTCSRRPSCTHSPTWTNCARQIACEHGWWRLLSMRCVRHSARNSERPSVCRSTLLD
jgi:hypothetical protein